MEPERSSAPRSAPVVDDRALIRRVLADIVSASGGFRVAAIERRRAVAEVKGEEHG
jgi:chemotaxis response regulator CheB